MVADSTGGIYFRPESKGQQILVGSIRPEDEQERVEDPDAVRPGIDEQSRLRLLHGHGFKLAPAIGSMIAQLLTGTRLEGDTDVSPDFLSIHRDSLAVNRNERAGLAFRAVPAVGRGALPAGSIQNYRHLKRCKPYIYAYLAQVAPTSARIDCHLPSGRV